MGTVEIGRGTMTGNVVNLNKVRKAKAKIAKRSRADANAVKFGRSKSDKVEDAARLEKSEKLLDGHKRDT